MRYLVTGSNGFIGSHLVERLLEDGHQVIGIDDFSQGKPDNLKPHHRLVVIKASILDDIGTFFERIDVVFHLAAKTRPQESILDPMGTTNTNVLGTLNVLECCRANGVKRIIFVSSSSLYGEQKKLPTSETATPNPISPYALTKLVGEQYCKLFFEMYGLEYNCIRPFNVYGTRQSTEGGYAAAVPKFIESLKKGETPFITGDGKQVRDYIYIDDVIDLMVRASKSKVCGEEFNAGSGTNISINNLYKIIARLMNKDIKPNHVAEVLEPKMTKADIQKPRKLLGWKPKIHLEEGLRRTI